MDCLIHNLLCIIIILSSDKLHMRLYNPLTYVCCEISKSRATCIKESCNCVTYVLEFGAAMDAHLKKRVSRSIHEKYSSIASQIIDYCTKGDGRNRAYDRLVLLCDKFGSRFSGTQQLEGAIDYMISDLSKPELSLNVRGEDAMVSLWVRNEARAKLVTPREYSFDIMALGYSVGTPRDQEYLEAEAIVFDTFDEMEQRKDEIFGKIVIFNETFTTYEETAPYRTTGAARAGKYGAVATLIRSITPKSLYTLHTGYQYYDAAGPKIPTACITIEDSLLFARMQERGETITIQMFMNCENLPDQKSRNIVADLEGGQNPEEVVLISGHFDTWDVSAGALDDGGGVMIGAEALSVIRDLNLLTPRRTIRLCMFTAEETNLGGSTAFFERYKSEADKFSIMMESDDGTFSPTGLAFKGSEEARSIITEISLLLEELGATKVGDETELVAPDLDIWSSSEEGSNIPMGSLLNSGGQDLYFQYHHSRADEVGNTQTAEEMNRCTAVWAVYAYILADLEVMLPREVVGQRKRALKPHVRC